MGKTDNLLYRIKKLLHLVSVQKQEQEETGDQEYNPADGTVTNEDVDPSLEVVTLKKRFIVGVAALTSVFLVVFVASNFIKSQQTVQKTNINNSNKSAANPSAGAPDSYADLDKFNKELMAKKSAENFKNVPLAKIEQNNSGNQHQRKIIEKEERIIIPATEADIATAPARDKAIEQAISSPLKFNLKNEGVTEAGQNTIANNATISGSTGYFGLQAGAVIQSTLLTGISSDVANGDVVAQVRQNIYDSLTGEHLLIPHGSKLIGTSGAAGHRGNKRIGVIFSRIIFPNGKSINLPKPKAVDGIGFPGLKDKYDAHNSTLYRTAFMSALLSAVAQSSTGNTKGSDKRSPGQEAVSGAASDVLKTGQKIVERDVNMNPTIEIRPGFQFSVFLNKDLSLGEYSDD